MEKKFTGDATAFRQELVRQLHAFPGNDRYVFMYRYSEVSALLLFARSIFIYEDRQTGQLKKLKREWNSLDQQFVFAPGVYRTDLLKFLDIHLPVANETLLREIKSGPVNPPKRPTGIILDGTHCMLRIENGQLVSEKSWQLDEQLEGTLKILVDTINTNV